MPSYGLTARTNRWAISIDGFDYADAVCVIILIHVFVLALLVLRIDMIICEFWLIDAIICLYVIGRAFLIAVAVKDLQFQILEIGILMAVVNVGAVDSVRLECG